MVAEFFPLNEAKVEAAVKHFLELDGYRVVTQFKVDSGYVDLFATSASEELVIEAKGEDKGGYTSAEMNFQMGLGQSCRV